MYINEHIYVYKRTYFIISGTYPWLSVIKLLKIRLYNRIALPTPVDSC